MLAGICLGDVSAARYRLADAQDTNCLNAGGGSCS